MKDYLAVKFDYDSGAFKNYGRIELIQAKEILDFEKRKVNRDLEKFGRTITLESKLIAIDEILCELKKLKLSKEQ